MDNTIKRHLLTKSFDIISTNPPTADGNKSENPVITVMGYSVGDDEFTSGMTEKRLSVKKIFLDGTDFFKVKGGDFMRQTGSDKRFLVSEVRPYYKFNNILDYAVVYLK